MVKRVRKFLTIMALALVSISVMSFVVLDDTSDIGPTAMASFDAESFNASSDIDEIPECCFIPLAMGSIAVLMGMAVLILKWLEQ